MGSAEEKKKTIKFVPIWRALLNQNKNKEALKPYKNEMARMETPKVLLKLHYGSRTLEKSPKVTRKSILKSSSNRTTEKHMNEYKGKKKSHTCTKQGHKA